MMDEDWSEEVEDFSLPPLPPRVLEPTKDEIGVPSVKDSLVGCTVNGFLPTSSIFLFDRRRAKAERIAEIICDFEDIPSRQFGLALSQWNDFLEKEHRHLGFFSLALPDRCRVAIKEAVKAVKPTISESQAEWLKSVSVSDWQSFLKELSPSERDKLRQQLKKRRQDIIEAIVASETSSPSLRSTALPPPFDSLVPALRSGLTETIFHLGPLREEPKVYYQIVRLNGPNSVGNKGQYAAGVLELNQKTKVSYISPKRLLGRDLPRTVDEEVVIALSGFTALTTVPEISSLPKAVEAWLRYFELAEFVKSSHQGKLGHRVQIVLPGTRKKRDLTEVGLGISQVLPILVLGLLSPWGTTLVFEQPDLHLHPAVQARLADFFLSLPTLGKQCIVETHSEHLVNRLRLRGRNLHHQEQIKILGVLKSETGSIVKELEIKTDGSLELWPDEFFDESQMEEKAIEISTRRRRDQIQKIQEEIEKGENTRCEFKSSLRLNLHTQRIDKGITHSALKTIAAFQNTKGGTLYLGVSDQGEILGIEQDGFPNMDKFLLFLNNKVRDWIGQAAASRIEAQIWVIDGKKICQVKCLPSQSPEFLKFKGGRESFYVRTGPSTEEMSPSQMHKYIAERFSKI